MYLDYTNPNDKIIDIIKFSQRCFTSASKFVCLYLNFIHCGTFLYETLYEYWPDFSLLGVCDITLAIKTQATRDHSVHYKCGLFSKQEKFSR